MTEPTGVPHADPAGSAATSAVDGRETAGRFVATRRGVLLGAGATAAVTVLAACGSNAGNIQLSTPSTAETVAQLADVPVGGAVQATLKSGAKVLVTQPTAGQAHVFSAICTHQGCAVIPDAAKKDLYCPCHGSEFDLTSAKVLHGPAPKPLQELPSTVQGGAVVVGG